MDLPRPGLVGILIRLALSGLVLFMGYGAIVDAAEFWDGFTDPIRSLNFVAPLAIFTSWVVNELAGRRWGQRPLLVVLAGLAAMVLVGLAQGEPFGPWYGTYLWLWVLLFSVLLGPAHLIAAVLRTPGCEMRSYKHLWTLLRGGDPKTVVCPGWIDRFDGVRIAGRW